MKITKILTPVLYLLATLPAQTAPLVKATRIPGTFDRPLYVTSAPGANTLLFVVEQTGRAAPGCRSPYLGFISPHISVSPRLCF